MNFLQQMTILASARREPIIMPLRIWSNQAAVAGGVGPSDEGRERQYEFLKHYVGPPEGEPEGDLSLATEIFGAKRIAVTGVSLASALLAFAIISGCAMVA